MKEGYADWLTQSSQRAGGDILAVQTVRNALMAAGVLASAAMVALMGVLATSSQHQARWPSGLSAAFLVVSALLSLRSLWALSAIGFHLQFDKSTVSEVAARLSSLIENIRWAGIALIAALACAAGNVWLA